MPLRIKSSAETLLPGWPKNSTSFFLSLKRTGFQMTSASACGTHRRSGLAVALAELSSQADLECHLQTQPQMRKVSREFLVGLHLVQPPCLSCATQANRIQRDTGMATLSFLHGTWFRQHGAKRGVPIICLVETEESCSLLPGENLLSLESLSSFPSFFCCQNSNVLCRIGDVNLNWPQ